MSFLGIEYTFDREENFEEFVKSLDLTPEQSQGYLNYRPDQKLEQDGDEYTLTTTTPLTKKVLSFKSGVPFEEKAADRVGETTFTLEGNTLTQLQKFSDGNWVNTVRVFSDSELAITITSSKYKGSGTVRRFYKVKA